MDISDKIFIFAIPAFLIVLGSIAAIDEAGHRTKKVNFCKIQCTPYVVEDLRREGCVCSRQYFYGDGKNEGIK